MGCSLVAPALILLLAAALVAMGNLPDPFAMATDLVPLLVFGGGVLFGPLPPRYRPGPGVVVFAPTAAALVHLPASIPIGWTLAGVAFSAGIGIVFGLYPALRASRLDPIEAIRTE